METPDWLDVSRETTDKLQFFANEVLRWTPSINLISKASTAEIWQRHILDSAQIFALAPQPLAPWMDIGSGGGFPGLVMAIMGAPDVILVESDQRKAAFLREMARQMALPVRVIAQRLEAVPPAGARILTARALAALTELLAHATRHLADDGTAIFPKGRVAQDEVDAAAQQWRFDCKIVASKTDPQASLLVVTHIEPR